MLENQFDPRFIRLYFQVIKEYSSLANPIHRAKAMKMAKPERSTGVKLLNKIERDQFWNCIQSEDWVIAMENLDCAIVGLRENAENYLKREES